tara:strand:+ start:2887 stop:3243 length:357 start_codon:yes stop_codon:yes gene_type:complete
MARNYNGKKRRFKKTFAEKYIDRTMNDGVSRSSTEVVDEIITYINKTSNRIGLAYVPLKGKVSHYLSTNKDRYKINETNKINSYQRITLCISCDGSGYKLNIVCPECNSAELSSDESV